MKQIIVVALLVTGCSALGINRITDTHGTWNWHDSIGFYIINWKATPDSSHLSDEYIFEERAKALCEGDVLSSRFMGRNEVSSDGLTPAGGIYISTTRSDTYVSGSVRCKSNPNHVEEFEYYKSRRDNP